MTNTDIPPRDDGDWVDEAILAAILAIQFGNTAAERASTVFAGRSNRIVFDAIRDMGTRPTAARVRQAMARIDRAFRRGSKGVRDTINQDILTLASIERRSLDGRLKIPARSELMKRIAKHEVLGRDLDGYVDHWLERSAKERVKARVRHLSSSGTATRSIIARVGLDMKSAARGAGSIARTILSGASSLIRRITAKQNDRNLIWVSVLDDRTTIQCAALDGEVWAESEPHLYPPIHVNCRSMVAIHMGGNVDGTDYESWLRRQPESVQAAVLGVARSKAWRNGSLSIDDMVDATRTRVLDLETLEKLGRLKR